MKAFFKTMVFFFLISNGAFSQSDWKLEKNENQVQVYTRTVSGSKIKEFKAKTFLKANINKVEDLLLNFNKYVNWVDGCIQAKLIKKTDTNKFLYYLELSAPWPIKNREVVLEGTFSKSTNGTVFFEIKNTNTALKENNDHVRMPKFNAIWTISTKEDGVLEIVQQVHAEPGGSIPSWLANSKVTDGPLATFINLRKELVN